MERLTDTFKDVINNKNNNRFAQPGTVDHR